MIHSLVHLPNFPIQGFLIYPQNSSPALIYLPIFSVAECGIHKIPQRRVLHFKDVLCQEKKILKKFVLPFVSKYFGPVLWEACSFLHNEQERGFILVQPLDEGAVLGSQTSSLPFCLCFFRVPLHPRGPPSSAQPSRSLSSA